MKIIATLMTLILLSGCAHYKQNKKAYWIAGGVLATSIAISQNDGPKNQMAPCQNMGPSICLDAVFPPVR